MFRYKAKDYIEFAVLMLADDFISSLHTYEELRDIYFMVKDSDIKFFKSKESSKLKTKYLTADELKADSDAEIAREKERKCLEKEKLIQGLMDELTSGYDGTFKSIYKFLDKHDYSWSKEDEALLIAGEFYESVLAEKNYVLGKSDLGYFLSVGAKLYRKGIITFDCYKNHVCKIVEIKEELIHVEVENE